MLRRGLCLIAGALLLAPGACGGDARLECHRGGLTTESSLSLRDLRCGEGIPARRGDVVTVHYMGKLAGGPTFDSSRLRRRPFTFPLGRGQVIRGWDEGLVGMRPGGRRRLVIPPELAFGDAGYLDLVPPDATLVFLVELVEVRPADRG